MKKFTKQIVTLTMMAMVAISAFSFALTASAQTAPIEGSSVDTKFFGGTAGAVNTGLGLGAQDPRETASKVINVMMGFLGIVAVVIILIGGFKWMTASGDEGKVDEAKKLMYQGVIGLAIILSAWGLTIFVMTNLLTATGGA